VRFENGDIRYSYVIAPDHPSGLYWFHPHPHGLSEVQVSNGLLGLMSIGRFWDTATQVSHHRFYRRHRTGRLPGQQAQREELQAEHEADRSLRVRYLGLKDIQVSKLTDSSRPAAVPANRVSPAPRAGRSIRERRFRRPGRCAKEPLRQAGPERIGRRRDHLRRGGRGARAMLAETAPRRAVVFTVSGQ